jgi:excisionase family DNA binding protein
LCLIKQLQRSSKAHRLPDPVGDLMTTPQFEPLLSQVEAGQLLQLHEKTVARMARLGQLPAIRMGRYWRFRASTLNQWVNSMLESQRQFAPCAERKQ